MVYDISCHIPEVPQQTKLGETAQIYRFVPLTQDRNEPPRYLNGLDLWKPPDANFDDQKLPYIPADVVKLMLPFGPELMRYDPTLPPHMQSLEFPELFIDAMRIRRDVIVRNYGGKLEDIASDLWDDSVSLHWVVYVTDYVDHELIVLGARKKYIGNKLLRRFPVGTIKVRPVIGMVRFRPFPHPLSHLRSSKPWRLTTTSHSQRQPENTEI